MQERISKVEYRTEVAESALEGADKCIGMILIVLEKCLVRLDSLEKQLSETLEEAIEDNEERDPDYVPEEDVGEDLMDEEEDDDDFIDDEDIEVSLE